MQQRTKEEWDKAERELNASGLGSFEFNGQRVAMYHDKQGKPIGLGTWSRLCADDKYRQIARDETPGGLYWVSTVWLGVHSNFGPPHIFETMVFDTKVSHHEATKMVPSFDFHESHDQWRYVTLEEAEEGHKKLLRKWIGVEKRRTKK